MGRIKRFVTGAAAGAAVAYLYDPHLGRRRRAKIADMAASKARRTQGRIEREARFRAGQAEGLAYRATHRTPAEPEADDAVLKSRIESDVLTQTRFPGHEVNVTVVDGVAELRGQVPRAELIDELTQRVGSVAGVHQVRHFLHVPTTSAPNKEPARRASSEGGTSGPS